MATSNGYKGINTGDSVNKAKQAIKDYVADLEKYLNSLKSPEVSDAFVGDYAVSVKVFISGVIDEVKRSLEDLKAFDTKLETYKKQYQAEDTRQASNIGKSHTM